MLSGEQSRGSSTMQAVIAALAGQAKQATDERGDAEQRERQALFAVEDAKAAAAKSAHRRAEQVEILEQAAAAEQAGRDRLGPCRLAHADSERDLERIADTAALGSDPAARSIAKARDAVETAASIVSAHERRVRVLAGEREQAEAALAEHDGAELARVAAVVDGLVVVTATRIDSLLDDAVEAASALARLVAMRDGLPG